MTPRPAPDVLGVITAPPPAAGSKADIDAQLERDRAGWSHRRHRSARGRFAGTETLLPWWLACSTFIASMAMTGALWGVPFALAASAVGTTVILWHRRDFID
jgi:hypothetical protein